MTLDFFANTWEEFLLLTKKVLLHLEVNGFTVNPLKCKWAVNETDWLGYWLVLTGLKPWKKRISAILKKEQPCNLKEMHGFLGAVNAYCLMWSKHAHLFKPLSDESGKKTFAGPLKRIKPSNTWKLSWLQMSSWHTPTIACHFTSTMMPLIIKWVLSLSNSNAMLCIGPKIDQHPTELSYNGKGTIFHCYSSWNISLHAPWPIIKILPLLTLTVAVSYVGNCLWKNMPNYHLSPI